jgi:hypothetical protein
MNSSVTGSPPPMRLRVSSLSSAMPPMTCAACSFSAAHGATTAGHGRSW